MKLGFKGTDNWNKYQLKETIQVQDQNFDYLIYPRFQGVNRLTHKIFSSNCRIKDYNFIIDGRNVFDQSVKSDLGTYDNIQKIETDQGDDSTTDCLLCYPFLKKY